MPSQASKPRVSEGLVVVLLAAGAALAALLYYFRQDALLLYGDAVAHLHIARRVVDGRYPGPFELGTVWLPLPHILLLPFVAVDWMWRTGVAGAVVSMVSYVAGSAGVFRLVRGMVAPESAGRRVAPWLAAAIFALNPNLLYLQTTAMTEPLYLALFVWTVVFLAEFARQAR
ncbi:MAG: family 2 glycosyl transferase, partial [Acidobacteriota bacterium]|nr:family 2 glycosyl transferase [Acidobacteriota bacterium]